MKQTLHISDFNGRNNEGTVETRLLVTQPFNWLEVLGALAKGAELAPGSATTLRLRAGNWPSCACGELCQALPKGANGCPRDTLLYDLGLRFSGRVSAQDWRGARRTFKQIEERVAELL